MAIITQKTWKMWMQQSEIIIIEEQQSQLENHSQQNQKNKVKKIPRNLHKIIQAEKEKAELEEVTEQVQKVAEEVSETDLEVTLPQNGYRLADIEIYLQNKLKVMAVIEKLETKLALVSKRIHKRIYLEHSLKQLNQLYGKFLESESTKVEKQLKLAQDGLFAELKVTLPENQQFDF